MSEFDRLDWDKQAGLVPAEQAGDADGRAHVAQGFVRVADAQAIVFG